MIIGIVGKAGSGKDTVGEILGEYFGVYTMSFAQPLKKFVRDVFDFSTDQIWGASHYRNEVDPRYGFAPREALQKLGTEWGRALYPNVWADFGIRRAQGLGKVAITDCRFQNEADAIRAAGGVIWRVVRPGAGLEGAAGQHASEVEQDSIHADTVLTNDGTLEDLRRMVILAGQQLGLK